MLWLWPEIETKLERTLSPLFKNLKDNRVKVNEDKAGLMILGDRKARRKIVINGGEMEIKLAGKKIIPSQMEVAPLHCTVDITQKRRLY